MYLYLDYAQNDIDLEAWTPKGNLAYEVGLAEDARTRPSTPLPNIVQIEILV